MSSGVFFFFGRRAWVRGRSPSRFWNSGKARRERPTGGDVTGAAERPGGGRGCPPQDRDRDRNDLPIAGSRSSEPPFFSTASQSRCAGAPFLVFFFSSVAEFVTPQVPLYELDLHASTYLVVLFPIIFFFKLVITSLVSVSGPAHV